MSNDFDDLLAIVDPLLDEHYGEAFTVIPKVAKPDDVNGRKVTDGSRVEHDFTGIWSAPHAKYWPESRSGHTQALTSKTGADAPEVDFATASLPYRCQIGDVVVRQATGARYKVSDVDNDDSTRTILHLTAGS